MMAAKVIKIQVFILQLFDIRFGFDIRGATPKFD
jgi:hypothetical protein